MNRRLAWVLATGGGSGKFPFAPGTAGSFVALIIYWFILPDSSAGLSSLEAGSALLVAGRDIGYHLSAKSPGCFDDQYDGQDE